MYPAYAELYSDFTSSPFDMSILRMSYSRRMNDVGRCEMEVLLPQVDELIHYSGRALIVLRYRGRVEDIYSVVDYERSRFGTVRLYGENAAAILRDTIMEAPSDSASQTLSGDISVMLRDAIEIPSTIQPLAVDYLWRVNAMRAGFSGDVRVSWGSPIAKANAVVEKAELLLEARYPFGWYVRGHGVAFGIPRASFFVVIPRYIGSLPAVIYAESVKFEYSGAYNVVFGLGKGLGSDRDTRWARSPLRDAVSSPYAIRLGSSSKPADNADMAVEDAVYTASGRVSGTIKTMPNTRYWDYFELGDIITVQADSHLTIGRRRAVSGSIREIRGELTDGVVTHTIDLA